MITTFVNHAPINFENAHEIASWDAGRDFGHHTACIKQGNTLHLYESYNSGTQCGSHEPKTTRTYRFGCRSREEMVAFLLRRLEAREDGDLPAAAWNHLLRALGYEGEPA